MVWSLEIHHLDIGKGDSTLIVARNDGVGQDQVAQTRSVLIDGGLGNAARIIHPYLTTAAPNGAGLAALDVMVCTHYDTDHMNGLRGLLTLGNTNAYDNTIIFDQGEQGSVVCKRRKIANDQTVTDFSYEKRDDPYIRYANAAAGRQRQRVTAKVYPDSTEPRYVNMLDNTWHDAKWLVGKEIMWMSGLGVAMTPGSVLNAFDPNAARKNRGEPTLTCIAANQYIINKGETKYVSGLAVDPRNEMSLAFVLKFNKFKYYIGGDIETTQETQFQNYLSASNNLPDRVLAMKASHHGSDRSTDPGFLGRLNPLAAFISIGFEKRFGTDANGPVYLPRNRVLTDLQNSSVQHYYLTEDRDRTAFNARVGQIVAPPGPNVAGNMANAYTAKAVVAGGWGGAPYRYPNPLPTPRNGDVAPQRVRGHVVLKVTEAQSNTAVSGQLQVGESRFSVDAYAADALGVTPNINHVYS